MTDLFSISYLVFGVMFVVFTFLKRDLKKRILKSYRLFSNETIDGFIGESVNLFFPIPNKSSNPDFYKDSNIQLLVKKFKRYRFVQFLSFGLLTVTIVLHINYGF